MKGDHRLVAVEKNLADDRCRARCLCGFSTGWRRDHSAAVRAVGEHVDDVVVPMSSERAVAILADHYAGLHEEFDSDDCCRWPDCQTAYEFVEEAKGDRDWQEWRSLDARREQLR